MPNKSQIVRESYASTPEPWRRLEATGRLVLADGTILSGRGLGAVGEVAGEVCFNTAMTGYQEILTDPSYAGQIVTFTFPHIGNVGANDEDIEMLDGSRAGAVGCVLRAEVTPPSNFRATGSFEDWLERRGIVGISGVDTRALTAKIRDGGLINAVLAHEPQGRFDEAALRRRAAELAPMAGRDLVPDVTSGEPIAWNQTSWKPGRRFGQRSDPAGYHVVAIDYGAKRNILRLLADRGCRVTVVSATTPAADILALEPDGVFLSNGPGDPEATGRYAIPIIRELLEADIPMFGICLGHQLLALALGGRTVKMHQGHHGANHPVKDHTTGKVEIVSMNHGFSVDADSLPGDVRQTHVSLFDGSNCGLALEGRPVFSVQHHPEASPGPQDSHYLFERFVTSMAERVSSAAANANAAAGRAS